MANDWTVTELAQEAGVTTGYVRHLILTGQLKAVKRAKTWFIGDKEAQRWLAERAAHPPRPGRKLRGGASR